jgi:hypothetical protein
MHGYAVASHAHGRTEPPVSPEASGNSGRFREQSAQRPPGVLSKAVKIGQATWISLLPLRGYSE